MMLAHEWRWSLHHVSHAEELSVFARQPQLHHLEEHFVTDTIWDAKAFDVLNTQPSYDRTHCDAAFKI